MKLNRIVAFSLGLSVLASTLLVYAEYVYMLGFPDGSITELGYAERKLAFIFIGISFVAAACFINLGAAAAAAEKKIGKKLSALVVLYLISVFCLFVIDNYFRSHLDNGAGG